MRGAERARHAADLALEELHEAGRFVEARAFRNQGDG